MNKQMKWINLKITSRCNLNCSFCYEKQNKTDVLTFDDIKCIIDKVADCGYTNFRIYGGEPTLREDFCGILKYAALKGGTIHVATNGLLLTEEYIHSLLATGIERLYCSLGELSNYRLLERFQSDIYPVFQKTNNNDKIAAIIIITKKNIYEIDKILKWLDNIGLHHLGIIPLKKSQNRNWYRENKLDYQDYLFMTQRIYKWWHRFRFELDCSLFITRYVLKHEKKLQGLGESCMKYLYIDSMGYLHFCSFREYPEKHMKVQEINNLQDYLQTLNLDEKVTDINMLNFMDKLNCLNENGFNQKGDFNDL